MAEFTVALVQTLNRKTHRAYNRVREGNFILRVFLERPCTAKLSASSGWEASASRRRISMALAVGYSAMTPLRGMTFVSTGPWLT